MSVKYWFRVAKYFWWLLYYLPKGKEKTLAGLFAKLDRTRPPWWKFHPSVIRNGDGNNWDVILSDEPYFVRRQSLDLDVFVSEESGHIIGLHLYDYQLRPEGREL